MTSDVHACSSRATLESDPIHLTRLKLTQRRADKHLNFVISNSSPALVNDRSRCSCHRKYTRSPALECCKSSLRFLLLLSTIGIVQLLAATARSSLKPSNRETLTYRHKTRPGPTGLRQLWRHLLNATKTLTRPGRVLGRAGF